MEFVEPKVFLIGETRIQRQGLQEYLEEIGAPAWKSVGDPLDSEEITEIMSRGCYNSFEVGLNPNVTRIREGNGEHLANITKVGHGSVMEHAVLNFMFVDVSRVLTHELVRHRVGVAISQQSLRFVRLEKLKAWLPSCFRGTKTEGTMRSVFEVLESTQKELAEEHGIDDEGVDFAKKKKLTSAFRRIAPIGLATNIGWSCNFRALRFVLEQRTDPSAEEEIRLVFDKVWRIVSERYPSLMQGYETEMVDGYVWVKPSGLRKV